METKMIEETKCIEMISKLSSSYQKDITRLKNRIKWFENALINSKNKRDKIIQEKDKEIKENNKLIKRLKFTINKIEDLQE